MPYQREFPGLLALIIGRSLTHKGPITKAFLCHIVVEWQLEWKASGHSYCESVCVCTRVSRWGVRFAQANP